MLVKMGLRLFNTIMILQAITGDQKQTILIHEMAIRVCLYQQRMPAPKFRGAFKGITCGNNVIQKYTHEIF